MSSTRAEWVRVRRAERYFLRWPAPTTPVPDYEATAITSCLISHEAKQDFARLLTRRGQWQGGPIFGLRDHGVLHVLYARPGGYWPMLRDGDPYDMDMGYMLGLSDSQSPAQVDWQGHWLAAPDSMMPSDVQGWADEGRQRGIIDDEHPLVVVGHDRDGLTYWGLIWRIGEQAWDELTIQRA